MNLKDVSTVISSDNMAIHSVLMNKALINPFRSDLSNLTTYDNRGGEGIQDQVSPDECSISPTHCRDMSHIWRKMETERIHQTTETSGKLVQLCG